MASSAPNRLLVARAAAVLTASEVAATRIDLNETWGAHVSIQVSFTVGMLTEAVLRHYVSVDGVTYFPLTVDGGDLVEETMDDDATRAWALPCLAGWKFYRASIEGTGTVTDSSATITYRYLRRGSQ